MKVNIKDVAQAAGVAQSTVSRVMNKSGYVSKETYHKVMKAMDELGYSPSALAVSFSKSQTRIIGFIVPNIGISFFGKLLFAVDKLATQNNYRMILCNSDDNPDKERRAIMDLLSYKVGGILIVPVENSPNADLINRIHTSGTPVICIDKEMPGAQCDTIHINNENGAQEMTRFALQKGHRDMAFLIYDSHASVTASYIRGIKNAYRANHLDPSQARIFTGTQIDSCSDFIRMQYLSPKGPSAILSFSSDFTVICYHELVTLQARIGQDIDLIGYDNMKILESYGYRVQQSPGTEDMGILAIRMLLNRIENPGECLPSQYVTLPASVKISYTHPERS